jgi:hypothetical protein
VWGTRRDLTVYFASKLSHARISQFDFKTNGGVTTDGARCIIVEVASSES